MKTYRSLWMIVMLMLAFGMNSCSSDDDTNVNEDINVESWERSRTLETNTLLIQSAEGKTDIGQANGSRCYIGEMEVYKDGGNYQVYTLSFACGIDESTIFNNLKIDFQRDKEISYEDLKIGDTFDNSQFHAQASIYPTWHESFEKVLELYSGKILVVDKWVADEKLHIVLDLQYLRFGNTGQCAIDGIVEFETFEFNYSYVEGTGDNSKENFIGTWHILKYRNGWGSERDFYSGEITVTFTAGGEMKVNNKRERQYPLSTGSYRYYFEDIERSILDGKPRTIISIGSGGPFDGHYRFAFENGMLFLSAEAYDGESFALKKLAP